MITLIKFLLPLIFFLSTKAFSFVFFSPYGALNLGSSDFNQTISGTNWLDHNNNNIGIELGTRMGLDFKFFRLGGVAAINWTHHDGRRSDQDGFFFWEKEGYDATLREIFYGAYAAIPTPLKSLLLTLEYYPDVSGKFTYSDGEGNNPFNTKDKLAGSGFSIGFIKGGDKKNSKGRLALNYRYIKFRTLERNSVKQYLSSYNLEEISESMLIMQFTVDLH